MQYLNSISLPGLIFPQDLFSWTSQPPGVDGQAPGSGSLFPAPTMQVKILSFPPFDAFSQSACRALCPPPAPYLRNN